MKQLFFLSIIFLICISCEPKEFSYEALNVIKDYDEGIAKARIENKPIFLYFTCHGCMGDYSIQYEQMLGNWETYTKLRDEFINVWLYVDERRKVEPYTSPLSGRTIRDIGNKWADFQKEKFGEQTQPLFVILDANGNQLSKNPIGYKEAKHGGLLRFLKSIE